MTKSRRPYLIRAIYDWCCDNGHTPHMLVAADYPGVVVPREYVQEGRITLNVMLNDGSITQNGPIIILR